MWAPKIDILLVYQFRTLIHFRVCMRERTELFFFTVVPLHKNRAAGVFQSHDHLAIKKTVGKPEK